MEEEIEKNAVICFKINWSISNAGRAKQREGGEREGERERESVLLLGL